LKNVSLRVPPSNLRDLSLFDVCPSNNHCPSARCAYVVNAVGKDPIYLQSEPFLSITFILINLKFLVIFVHNPNVLCYVVLSYHVVLTSLHLCLFVSLRFSINLFFPHVNCL
jgi:hypothetical protein